METINHECYVSLDIAKLLKEAGFDWETRALYFYDCTTAKGYILAYPVAHNNWNAVKDDDIDYLSAPTLEVTQRWLREVKGVEVNVVCVYILNNKKYSYVVFKGRYNHELIEEGFDTYEEAQEAGIKKALEILLEK